MQLWVKMQGLFTSLPRAQAIGSNERSVLTVLIYFNEDMEREATELFRHKVPIVPKIGRLLAFVHRQLHAGHEVTSGIKYVLRSDVMYRVSNE